MPNIISRVTSALSDIPGFEYSVLRSNPYGMNVLRVKVSQSSYDKFDSLFCSAVDCAGFEVTFLTSDDRAMGEYELNHIQVPVELGVGQVLSDMSSPLYTIIDANLASDPAIDSLSMVVDDPALWLEQLIIVLDKN